MTSEDLLSDLGGLSVCIQNEFEERIRQRLQLLCDTKGEQHANVSITTWGDVIFDAESDVESSAQNDLYFSYLL